MLSQRVRDWIASEGNRKIAELIDVRPSSIRSYLTERKEIRPRRAAILIRTARTAGVDLDYADFFGDPLTRPITAKKEESV